MKKRKKLRLWGLSKALQRSLPSASVHGRFQSRRYRHFPLRLPQELSRPQPLTLPASSFSVSLKNSSQGLTRATGGTAQRKPRWKTGEGTANRPLPVMADASRRRRATGHALHRLAGAEHAGSWSPGRGEPRGMLGLVVYRRGRQPIGCRAGGEGRGPAPVAGAVGGVCFCHTAAGGSTGVARRGYRRAEMPEAARFSASSGAESDPECPMETESALENSRRRHKVPRKAPGPFAAGYGLAAPLSLASPGLHAVRLVSGRSRPLRWRGPGRVCARRGHGACPPARPRAWRRRGLPGRGRRDERPVAPGHGPRLVSGRPRRGGGGMVVGLLEHACDRPRGAGARGALWGARCGVCVGGKNPENEDPGVPWSGKCPCAITRT